MKIEKLRLKAFRGATKDVSIDFDPDKKITMIFGENGTGKSTIIDGITFLCNQTVGSLEDRSGAGEKKFLVSAGQKPSDLLVELKAANGGWAATLSGKNITVTPNTGYPMLRVLRRAQLSAFVDEAPSERYKRIKEFIETPGIEKSEQSLRDAEKEARQKVEELVRDYSKAETQLTEAWEREGNPGADSLSWAKGIISKDVSALEKENNAIQSFSGKVTSYTDAVDNLQKAINEEKPAADAYAQAQNALEVKKKEITDGSTELLSVLKEAQAYIEQNQDAAECPVCTKGIDAASLKNDLGTRISALSGLETAVATVSSTLKNLERAQNKTATAMQSTATALKAIQDFLEDSNCSLPSDLKPVIDATTLATANDNTLDTNARLAAMTGIQAALGSNVTALTARMEENRKHINIRSTLSVWVDTLTKNQDEQKLTKKLQEKLKAVLTVVEHERKEFVKKVFLEISQDLCDLYEKIHPGEKIANVSLNLDPNRRGSINIISQFFSENDVPPQAYFSESHLDTLGICIWLAFTKKFAPPHSILILDDVLTSVDSAHLDRIIHLIDDEAQNFGHVIMTTHYRPWRDRYRTHQAAGSKIHYIELKEWAESRGLLTSTSKPELDELKAWLDPVKFERQIVAAKAGIFLESILDDLALKYRRPMPRKAAQDYTLGELLAAFGNKQRTLLKTEHLDTNGTVIKTVELGPILDDIDTIAWVRNQVGCHFNVTGQNISDADIRIFGEKVVMLAEALICAEGGDVPKNTKSGSYLQSKNGRCRLHPLQMP